MLLCIVVNVQLKHNDQGFSFPYISQLGVYAPERWILLGGILVTFTCLMIIAVQSHQLLNSHSNISQIPRAFIWFTTVSAGILSLAFVLVACINHIDYSLIHATCAGIGFVFIICFMGGVTASYSWISTDDSSIFLKLTTTTLTVAAILGLMIAQFWTYCATPFRDYLVPTLGLSGLFTFCEYSAFASFFVFVASMTLDFGDYAK